MSSADSFRAIVVDRETDAAGRPRLVSTLRELGVDELRTGAVRT